MVVLVFTLYLVHTLSGVLVKVAAILGLISLFCVPTLAQIDRFKKGDRPVFYSAGDLAEDCQAWLKVFPGGKPLPNNDEPVAATNVEVISAIKCAAYINGALDGELEPAFGSHYHPVPTRLTDNKLLIDTMLKYLADHPEEQNFAASTILNKARKIIANAQAAKK